MNLSTAPIKNKTELIYIFFYKNAVENLFTTPIERSY